MDIKTEHSERTIGLDSHPDSFTSAIMQGSTPREAVTQKVFNKIPMAQLQAWAKKHTTTDDIFVLEASGNSFNVVRELAAISRKAVVMESRYAGKLKEAHANNDRISAVRIAKAYLAGTAKLVWVPDEKTQERRDWHHAHLKAVKRTTQVRSRLLSYLSDNGVRFAAQDPLSEEPVLQEQQIRQSSNWTTRQWQVIQGMLMEERHAQEQCEHWTSLIAQEVLSDEQLLSLVRLCGVRDIVAFALGAIIGDINRFKSPKALVNYVGLSPNFDDSGNNENRWGIGGHGRCDLRALLIQSAHSILRSKHPLGKWGCKLLARRGEKNLAVAAVARKLLVAVWYLMKGRWTALEEIDTRLSAKIGKIITHVGAERLKELGKKRSEYRTEIHARLKATKIYVLDPSKKIPVPERLVAASEHKEKASKDDPKLKQTKRISSRIADRQTASRRTPVALAPCAGQNQTN